MGVVGCFLRGRPVGVARWVPPGRLARHFAAETEPLGTFLSHLSVSGGDTNAPITIVVHQDAVRRMLIEAGAELRMTTENLVAEIR